MISLPASATIVSGHSAAYDLYVNLDVQLTSAFSALLPGAETNAALTYNLSQTPLASGSAPAPYVDNDAVVSVTVNSGTSVTTIALDASGPGDVITASAASDVDGAPGSRTTSAVSQVDSLSLGASINTGALGFGILDLFSIDASNGTLGSTSDVFGDFGGLNATGVSFIENASFGLLGQIVGLDLSSDAATPPNTQISPSPGLVSIIINEQTTGGNSSDSAAIAVNALHLDFGSGALVSFNFGGLIGTVNIATISGEVIIGHSEADQASVPAAAAPIPGTLPLLLGGLLAFGGFNRRRNASTAAQE